MIKPPFPDQVFTSINEWYTRVGLDDAECIRLGKDLGSHFYRSSLVFDAKGRRCLSYKDFQRAANEEAFPVWWVWPDQIPELVRRIAGLERVAKLVDDTVTAFEAGFTQDEWLEFIASGETDLLAFAKKKGWKV